MVRKAGGLGFNLYAPGRGISDHVDHKGFFLSILIAHGANWVIRFSVAGRPIEIVLTGYEVQGLAIGAYGEASPEVHDMLQRISEA